MYIWNNIFFSLGFDVRDHYKDFGGDYAAYAAPVRKTFTFRDILKIKDITQWWTLVELCHEIMSQQFMWLGPAVLIISPSMCKD